MLASLWLLLVTCLGAREASANCQLAPDTIRAVEDFIKEGVPLDNNFMMAAGCQAAGQIGGAIGGAGGGAMGAGLGYKLGGVIDYMIGSDDDWECNPNGSKDCGVFGYGLGWMGAFMGGSVGAEKGSQFAQWSFSQFFTVSFDKPKDVISECYEKFGLTPQHSFSDIVAAYRALSKDQHPDKDGSHEEQVKLNLCREVLRHAKV